MPAETKFELKLGAATREAFGRTLVELGRENKDIVVCDADLSKSTMTTYFAEGISGSLLLVRHRRSEYGGGGLRHGIRGEDSVRIQLLGVRHEQGLRATAGGGGVSESQSEGRGDAQRHFDRRRRPVANERGRDRARLFAGQFRGDRARRRSLPRRRWSAPRRRTWDRSSSARDVPRR